MQSIREMTLEELTQLIDERIAQQIHLSSDSRTMAEVNASIRRHRIVPPAQAKSALDMLREDRDR